jgi:hypothetical protein
MHHLTSRWSITGFGHESVLWILCITNTAFSHCKGEDIDLYSTDIASIVGAL